MIVESIFNLLFSFVFGIFQLFPSANWTIPDGVFNTVQGIIGACCYFLPMHTVVAILGIVLWINIFRIGVSFIKTLWQIIPFL